ncbi:MAG: PAS domain-containing protein, partial [Verrucomicrobiota bacterium]
RFEDEGRFSDEDPGAFGNTQSETISNDEDVTKIRRELLTTQDYLQSTVEEFETSNEALQTTNEELLTANEELQSTNEELHSVNEELFTVNTEYKQKNGELKKLNSDFKKLLENTKIGTIFLDQDLTVRRFTPVAAETLNLIPRDLGRPIFHISHNFIEYQDLAEDAKRVHETAQYFEREARTRNGEAYLLRFLPDKKSEDEARGVVLTFINISDLKKAEASISEHQNRLDMAEQIANLGTWDWNISKDQVTLDDRFASVSGLPLQGIVTSEEFFREIDASCDQDPHAVILSQIAAKDVIDHHWDLNLPNGQRRYLKGHGAVKRDHSRNPVSFRGVISDQTELKKQQETVSQQKADLETLLYVISHDLREPLRAIHNFSQFLTREEIKADSEKSENYLSRIMRASERMDAFLNEVMLLSRLQKMEIPYERISGNIIVEQALRSLENRIEQTRAQVTVAKDLPELKVSITWAKQAIFNLLANALKFVNPGERPDILVSPYVPLENEYRYSGIVVQDRGPGIPPESVERVFKLFQRAVGNEIEGTGAGLAIVKEVAMKHGGNVYYEARKSGGSRFTITFLK